MLVLTCIRGRDSESMIRRWSRFGAAALLIALTSAAGAETLAATLAKWGLLGTWAVDCSLRPDRDKGALLTYEIKPDGRVMYRRDVGDVQDESEVVAASGDADGLLNIMVFFPSLHQTREIGLLLGDDGSLRAIYNRDEHGAYTIRDGKFVATGAATPVQHRCSTARNGQS